MAPLRPIRVPTNACLPGFLLIPSSTRALIKSLSRLSRAALIAIALEWLQDKNQPACKPYLVSNRGTEESEEEDYAYPPANNIHELRQIYRRLRCSAGTKRDIVDRILDGDWRRGLSLHQIAIVDLQFLQDHDSALRWTALKVVPIDSLEEQEIRRSAVLTPVERTKPVPASLKEFYPSFHASTFLRNLQREIAPVVKAHFYLERLSARSLTILRLYVTDSPYASSIRPREETLTDSSRTLFIVFPDSCPFIYVSILGSLGVSKPSESSSANLAHDIMSLKKITLEAVPKAMSRPHYRYGLENTSFSAKSLSAMLNFRGPGKRNASQGAYAIFAEGSVDESPLNPGSRRNSYKKPLEEREDDRDPPSEKATGLDAGKKRKRPLQPTNSNLPIPDSDNSKKRKVTAGRRFGSADVSRSGSNGIDRCQIRFADPLIGTSTHMHKAQTDTDGPPKEDGDQAGNIAVVFHGSDVFSGIRQLVEAGVITEEKMPTWMTGELGVSSGVVRNGELLNDKGGGA